MDKVIKWFSGRKTILTGLVMITLGLLQGESNLVMEGLGLIFLRLGVKKISETN